VSFVASLEQVNIGALQSSRLVSDFNTFNMLGNEFWEKIYRERKLLERYKTVIVYVAPKREDLEKNRYYSACIMLEQGLKEKISKKAEATTFTTPQLWGVPSVKDALSVFTDENSYFLASILGDGGVGKTSLVRQPLDH
jgi:tRNA A37 N6-isopentenylltransferase MiaA